MISLNYTIFVQFVLFIILMTILKRILFQPVLKVLKERDERTSGFYDNARELEEQSGSRVKDYETKISEAKAALTDTKNTLRAEAGKDVDKMIAKAEAEAAEELAKLKKDIEDEANAARESLKDEAQTIAREMAVKVLGRELN